MLIVGLACSRADLPIPTPGPATDSAGLTHVAPGLGDEPSPTPALSAPIPVSQAVSARLTPTPDPPHALAATRQAVEQYTVQTGDTLGTIAQRYGLGLSELIQANQLASPDSLFVGQVLFIPVAQRHPTGPGFKILPDSGLVYGPTTVGFDVNAFVQGWGGYLSTYTENVDGEDLSGARIVQLVAQRYSTNPRLLLALLEHQSGWVTRAGAGGFDIYPMRYTLPGREGLYQQLAWASDSLNAGYYGWGAGAFSAWSFPSGGAVGIDLTINPGTAGVQHFFSDLVDEAEWTRVVSPGGFDATYEALFGYPFDPAEPPILPPDLTQPDLRLPFEPGMAWVFTGGPHGGWESGSAWAALDFAPPAEYEGCTPSAEWVAAAASGQVVRSEYGAVIQDLDGDGLEQTGWVLFYMHVAEAGRVPVGTRLQAGDRVGHPSCEGGFSNGTHLHFARKYNGEWIAADGPIPFVLDGWVSSGLGKEYDGKLIKGDVSIEACDCRAAANTIVR